MRASILAISGLTVVISAPFSLADDNKANNPWANVETPLAGKAKSIGGYSAGCVIGAVELPQSGVGFQVMRPKRKRNFGHPQLIAVIQDIAAAVDAKGKGPLLVADLGQPGGGPAPSGHSSHQSGLDADIWFWAPSRARKRKLTTKERNTLAPRPIVSPATKQRTKHWSRRIAPVLELAASDKRVARIFVNPIIKRELCEAADDNDAVWLRKLRPWWGHNSHFHLRLECPLDSKGCESQATIPSGDGCDEVDWWLSEKSQADRKKGRKRYRKKVRSLPDLPDKCDERIASDG